MVRLTHPVPTLAPADTSPANEYCTILLAVDPEIEKHRQQLLKHQTAVMNAKSMLEKLAAEARADLGMPDRRGH